MIAPSGSTCGSKRLIEGIDGVKVAWTRRELVKGAIEENVGDGLPHIDQVYLRDRFWGFVLEDEVAGS